MYRRMTLPFIALSLLIVLSWASPAHAIFFWGAKSRGMGTATVAIADDNNAIEINPAGIAQGNHYAIDFNYERIEYIKADRPHWHPELGQEDEDTFYGGEFFIEDDTTPIDPDEKEYIDAMRFSVVDSKTAPSFAMGIHYTFSPVAEISEGIGHRAGLALAYNFADIVFIGGDAKFAQFTEKDNMFNADFGLKIQPVPFIGIGLAGHNVFVSDEKNKVNRDFTIGIAGYALRYAQIAVDVTKDFDADAENTWNFAFGAQGIVAGGLTLRGGFFWDQVDDANLWGAGIGWTDKDMGFLGYSFQGDVAEVRNFVHSIDITVKF